MTKPKRVVISWSSGKDSTLTLERLNENPDYQVVGLYTTYVGKEVPFQATPLEVVQMQADLLALPLITIELPEVFPSNDIYQSAIVNALQSSGLNVEAVAFGDMFCNGIADYRRSYIEPAGWKCVFPLLGENSLSLAMEVIERGIQAMLITIDGSVLSPEWCGRWYDQVLIESLPRHIDPCGENGEFHTLVTSTPSFQGHIELTKLEVEIGERFSHQRYRAKALPKQI
ncbi:TPA: adenine nucleotide alpha hydrolase [Vibrio parahaemolyticus]|uniref:adenine nucleotide alpha hydrolase n=1 Tax=Vibrio parahaemolyticus TaxID=670 RepID=UPI001E38E32C|nr:adenine nucleotide alpha hydrolase [Vibrio parahaemolyticus]MBE4295706.1 adenine nucleotide alpha hydrolase [Vibrio parahaemolyticus]HCE2390237.1 adenine nucleotide alpha hydrolase [Vibrio parahaemolyticus]HCE2672333.1 adenine nucleotide alpha hydrolase [Vibrio parahaemolyticus]HCE4615848.1 adenine nucleotide alpha hydrolase [Vibrio parahaemolyticus]HCG8764630.1 adenine nucleotide alpha hydrolase [Vibrio parahaemolyticus]